MSTTVLESEWEEYPACPACGAIDHDYWDGIGDQLSRDGDKAEWDCDSCGAPLTVHVSVSYEFQATTPAPSTPSSNPTGGPRT